MHIQTLGIRHDQEFNLLINGKLVKGTSMLDVINPATGKTFISVPRADEAQALVAIAAAKKAFLTGPPCHMRSWRLM
jgi:acyl-CoA reductase-like NAD-dependent aldehyde dehydrogenase